MMFVRLDQSNTLKDTHRTSWFKHIWRQVRPYGLILDPFARNCPLGTLTNDANETTDAMYHMDAQDFLRMVISVHGIESADFVILDPPFSARQHDEKYKDGDYEIINAYTVPGYMQLIYRWSELILKPGGRLLKLGYNSNQVGLMDLQAGWNIPVGANRNDIICTLWQKNQRCLADWLVDDDE